MQQNPILAVLKLIVLGALGTLVLMSFIQTEWLGTKVDKSREKVDSLNTTVAALERRMDDVTRQSDAARQASDRSYERLNAILDVMERSNWRPGPGDAGDGAAGNTGGGDPPRKAPGKGTGTFVHPLLPGAPDTEPTECNGVEVYARNKGFTVVCDTACDEDPDALLPADKVDWSATMHAYVTGEPEGLNNYGAAGNVTVETLWWYATDTLAVRKKSDLKQYQTRLAERIEESPDRTCYVIYLRKGVPWHRPALDMAEYPWLDKTFFVTAEDVKFTLDIIRDPNAGSPDKVQFEDITSVEILDEHTVLVVWNKARFYSRSAITDLWPMPSHIWANDPNGRPYGTANVGAAFNDHWFGKNICGNGPYRFVEYRPGSFFRYERFEQYYGQRAPCKEQYRYILPDGTQRVSRFLNEELDFISFQAHEYRQYILEGVEGAKFHKYDDFDNPAPGSWKFTYFIYTTPVYGGFAWNMRRPILKDARVRRALTLCLDRYAIADKIELGLAQVIAVGESVRSDYFPKDLEPLPFDIERAKALLDEAGWRTGADSKGIRQKMIDGELVDLEINLVLSASHEMQSQIAHLYKNDLLKAGIRLKADMVDSALWSQRKNDRDFDGTVIFWYAGFDSDPKQLWHSSKAEEPNSFNLTGFQSASADKIFEDLVTTFDYPTRIALMHKWYEMEFEQQPYTWFCAFKQPIIVNADWHVPEPRLTPRPYIEGRLVWKWKDRP
jgi:ABC-type transport system substrate-binding protein/outer membrane murein-binding lipoprotein Lpp